MAGLNEFIKLVNKAASNNYSGTKSLGDALAKFNSIMKDVNESINRYSGDGAMPRNDDIDWEKGNWKGVEYLSSARGNNSETTNLDLPQDEGTIKRNMQMDEVKAKTAMQISLMEKKDIFNYDISDERLVDGLIFSEILGPPASSRRRMKRHRYGRTR